LLPRLLLLLEVEDEVELELELECRPAPARALLSTIERSPRRSMAGMRL
jgi:hypothetical protein